MEEDLVGKYPVSGPGFYVLLSVSDNGTGMDEETRDRIFEPFYTTKEMGKGTGLGLATVYGLVKQSNGFIQVYSEPGQGTEFKIYFPVVSPDSPFPGGTDGSTSGTYVHGTVLLVEDDSSVRTLTARVLSGKGYTVIEAENGREALRPAGEYKGEIHLIVTDVVMPGMNGRELASKLESMRPGIKILYMSGYTDDAVVQHGILDSDVSFLQKPFSTESLVRKVRELIQF